MCVSVSSGNRDTLLRTIRFEEPDYIPMTFRVAKMLMDAMTRHTGFCR